MKVRFTHPADDELIITQTVKKTSKNYSESPNGDFTFTFNRYEYPFMLQRINGNYKFMKLSDHGDPFDCDTYDYGFDPEDNFFKFEVTE